MLLYIFKLISSRRYSICRSLYFTNKLYLFAQLTPSRADSNDSGDDAASALSLMPDIRVPMFEVLLRLSSLSSRNKTECYEKENR